MSQGSFSTLWSTTWRVWITQWQFYAKLTILFLSFVIMASFLKNFFYSRDESEHSLLKYRCTNLMEVKGKWRLKKLHRRVSLYPPCYRNVFICNGRFSLWTDTVQFVWSFRPLTSVSYVLLGDIYSSRWYIHLESRTNVSL